MTVVVPITTVSEANRRDHWTAKAQRVRNQRVAVYLYLTPQWRTKTLPPLPATITLTRLAPRLLDDDNAVGSMKAVRDEIAALYKCGDGSPLFTWKYAQEKYHVCAVRIEIESLKPEPVNG